MCNVLNIDSNSVISDHNITYQLNLKKKQVHLILGKAVAGYKLSSPDVYE